MDARGHVLSERCIDDEIPFEIPESWEWVRLETLLMLVSDGTHKTPEYKESGVKFLSVQNISKGFFDLSKVKYVSAETHNELCKRVKPQNGDMLLCRIGTLGKPIIVDVDYEFSIFVSLGLLRLINQDLNAWVVSCIDSPIGFEWIQRVKVGGGTHTFKINLGDIPSFLMPIPPAQEQVRIHSKLDELDQHVKSYGEIEERREQLDAELPDRLRKSILQMAVEGKLVPQNPNDEPASSLLERIRADRARFVKEKKIKAPKGGESVIYRASDGGYYEKRIDTKGRESEPVCIDDEIPFEVPESWEWARLETLCDFGACVNTEYAEVDEGVWNLDLEDLKKDTGRIVQKKRKAAGDRGSTKHIFKAGMVLYSKLRPYLNKVAIADEDGVCTPEILPLQFTGISSRYAQTVLMSPLFVEYAKAHSYGVKMPRLGTKDGASFLVPVPPCAEQQRIVHEATRVMVAIG